MTPSIDATAFDLGTRPGSTPRQAQTLENWTGVYDGLSDTEIDAVDEIAKTRANLTRNLP